MRFLPLFLLLSFSIQAQDWQLVWSDEFNGTQLDETSWSYDIGTGSQFGLNGWGNNELQYYTSNPANIYVSGGNLHIRAIQQNIGGMNYSSARIKSLNKRYWTYGRIEARIKIPEGQGMWPAFWMLPEGQFWPGEIDIMENVGSAPTTVWGTTHQGTVGDVYSVGGQLNTGQVLADDFHEYAIEWSAGNIKWFFDGIQYFEFSQTDMAPGYEWLFAQDYYLLLNVAVGGNWPGPPNGSTMFPQEMQVDYIRVYENLAADPIVTFQVDMSEENIQPGDVVYINGTFNNWCGSCNPLTEVGNGIWEAEISLPPGTHEFLYTTNGWNGLIESFASGEPCTLTTIDGNNTFVNRFVDVGNTDMTVGPACFNSCDLCPSNPIGGCDDADATNYDPNAGFNDGSCMYDVTFRVDANQLNLTPSDVVNVNGTFNNWCGACNALTDPDQDGIWETALTLPPGAHEYKFTTNGWGGEIEYFDEGASCTVTTYGDEVYTNRIIQLIDEPLSLDAVCFNSCEACVAQNANLSFTVDVFDLQPSSVSAEVYSEQWDGVIPMNYLGWGIWQLSVEVQSGSTVEWRFVADGISETVSGACEANGFRTIVMPNEDTVIDVVCFGTCDPCVGCNDPFAANFNPYAIADPVDCEGDYAEGCTYDSATNYNPAATFDNGTCEFIIGSSCPEDLDGNLVINAADLLSFLTAFGTFCE